MMHGESRWFIFDVEDFDENDDGKAAADDEMTGCSWSRLEVRHLPSPS